MLHPLERSEHIYRAARERESYDWDLVDMEVLRSIKLDRATPLRAVHSRLASKYTSTTVENSAFHLSRSGLIELVWLKKKVGHQKETGLHLTRDGAQALEVSK